ncbi:unnamed protein product [Protopolystoma xenopodis]|uniref:Uncharacterized protein n=1 Tax=Protopolystoma xenopodis TaxID=117903 RepID=A0A448XT55_9PLAT|nr:unnamed protein product [Protopolystoma xenopodis]
MWIGAEWEAIDEVERQAEAALVQNQQAFSLSGDVR